MEILSSGSFINLENGEKIDRLKFTAAELANAALESEGFSDEEEPAKKLALEFWQGLEYMCRESERATIQSIFLNHFLDFMRERRVPPASTQRIASPNESQIEPANLIESRLDSDDEFLGVIGTTRANEAVGEDSQTLPEEISNITDDLSAAEDEPVEDIEIETAETFLPESESSAANFNPETESSDPEPEVQEQAVASRFSLPEKEPYQFDKCTVTVAVQLLPVHENSEGRKAVLSVRTHDFAPNISLVELVGRDLTNSLAPELEKVLAKYQEDLPLKVMDKMKKEKNATKKIVPRQPTSETKTDSQAAERQDEVSSAAISSEPAQTTAPVIAQPAQAGLQGSLFG